LNPYMDFYAKASSVTYDAANNLSKCYLPYADITTFDPIVVIAGDASTADSGFTVKPERGSDGTGPYFSVVGKNWVSIKSKVIEVILIIMI